MISSNGTRKYYPALDGLRGIAILLVVFLHNFGFLNYFFFGWLGVDLFFVLSGFLITDILLVSVEAPHFLRNFYIRRILRIFPIYYLTLIFSFLILPNFVPYYVNMSYYVDNQFWLWTYLQNWLFVFKEPWGTKLLLHTWSLAVEEQFYLLWPIIILFVRKPKILLSVVIVVFLIVGISRYLIWHMEIKDLAYASLYTFTRIDGLCIGAMLSLIMKINPDLLKKYTYMIVLAMAGINFGFYITNTQHAFTLPYLAFVGYSTFAVLFGLLVYNSVTSNKGIIHFLLSLKVLKFFGRISYGLYVYHWPVYVLFFPFFRKILQNRLPVQMPYSQIFSAIIVTLLSILISVISFRYFESFFLKFKKNYN